MPIVFTRAALLPFYANEQCPAVAYESLSPALKKPAAKPSVHKKKPNQNKPKTYQKPENKPKTHQNKPKTTGSQVTGRPYQTENEPKTYQTENEPNERERTTSTRSRTGAAPPTAATKVSPAATGHATWQRPQMIKTVGSQVVGHAIRAPNVGQLAKRIMRYIPAALTG